VLPGEVQMREHVFCGVLEDLGGLRKRSSSIRATSYSLAIAETWSGSAKIIRTSAATASWACLGTTDRRFRMKWTRQGCQLASCRTLAIA
jgi:hypothetical protein